MARLRSSKRLAARRGAEKKVGTSLALDRRQLKKRGAKAVKKSKKASKRDKKASGVVEAVVAATMKTKTKRDNKSRQAKGRAQATLEGLEEAASASLQSWKRDQLECLLDNLDCEHESVTTAFTLKKDLVKAIKELEHRWTGLSAKEIGDKCKTWFKYTAKVSKQEYLRYLLRKSYEGVLISELRTFKPLRKEEDTTTEEDTDTTDDERPARGRKKAPKRTEVKKRAIHSARKTIGKRNEDFVEDEEEEEEEGSPVGRRTRSRGQVKVEKQRSRGAAAAAAAKKKKSNKKKKKKSPAAVPLLPRGGVRIKRERKAARGVKHYSDFALSEELGMRNYTGHFIQEKLDGTWYDGFVVDRHQDENGNDYYDVQINCLMSEDRSLHVQRMTPAQVSDCVVPFDKMVKRYFLRECNSGEVLFGRVTKYLGNLDAKNRNIVHTYRVSYVGGGHDDETLTNYILSGILLCGSDRQIERQIRRGSKKTKKKPSVKRAAGSAHPFRKLQRIDPGDEHTMIVTLFFFQQGKMNKQELEVPVNATVAVLKQCIWQESNWMNGWHPDLQSLVKGQTSLDKAKKSLADYGVGHGDLIGVDLEPREDSASDSDSEESSDEEADRWAGSVEHYKKWHEDSSRPSPVTRENPERFFDLPSPNKGVKKSQYIRWSLEETVELIKLVRAFFEKGEHEHAKMWSRINEVGGENGYFVSFKPGQLRIKWRTLKRTADIAPEDRRGANAKIPEDVFDQVRYVRDELEANAKRGSGD